MDVVRADPALRRGALLTLLALAIIGTIEIAWFLPWLSSLVETRAAQGRSISLLACISFVSIVALLAVPVTVVGVRVVKSGRAAVRHGRFPPPGTRVLRDTKVLEGKPAQVFGKIQRGLGIALVLCALALAVLGGYALALLT